MPSTLASITNFDEPVLEISILDLLEKLVLLIISFTFSPFKFLMFDAVSPNSIFASIN